MIPFGGYTRLEIDPDKVLGGAVGVGLEDVLVLGTKPDGTVYAASSSSNVAETLLLIETFKFKLLNGDYSHD